MRILFLVPVGTLLLSGCGAIRIGAPKSASIRPDVFRDSEKAYRLGLEEETTGQFEQAYREYTRAVEVDPDCALACDIGDR